MTRIEKAIYKMGKRDARDELLKRIRDLLVLSPDTNRIYTLREGVAFVLEALEGKKVEAPEQ